MDNERVMVMTDPQYYEDIANNIRLASGSTNKYYPNELAQAINDLTVYDADRYALVYLS